MPVETTRRIYTDFLFGEFLYSFKKYFAVHKKSSDPRIKHSYYSWDDLEYQNFMIDVLQRLEPVHYSKNKFIFTELDDVNEMIFI